MASKQGTFIGHFMLCLGILCGISTLTIMAWTWEEELSTGEIAWVVGLFSGAVSLVLSGFDRRVKGLQNQLQ